MKLEISLVPETSWYLNVRSNVSKARWDQIRKEQYRKAGYKCEICGDSGINQGFNHPVECHEIWEYNDKTHEQVLKGFEALCPLCHKVKHIGKARIDGNYDRALQHMMKVNSISQYEAETYIHLAFEEWEDRSQFEWDADITLIYH